MRLFSVPFLAFLLVADSLCAGNIEAALPPGTDDLSRFVATTAKRGGQTTLRDSSGRTMSIVIAEGTRTTLRDSSGRLIGNTTVEGNRTVFRDSTGRMDGDNIR